MSINTETPNLKGNVINDIGNILGQSDLWALMSTDEQGFVHVHTDNENNFLALLLCIFKDRPDLKEKKIWT